MRSILYRFFPATGDLRPREMREIRTGNHKVPHSVHHYYRGKGRGRDGWREGVREERRYSSLGGKSRLQNAKNIIYNINIIIVQFNGEAETPTSPSYGRINTADVVTRGAFVQPMEISAILIIPYTVTSNRMVPAILFCFPVSLSL